MNREQLLGKASLGLPKGKVDPQTLGLLSMAMPSPLGDVAGLLADSWGYAQEPKSLTPATGLLSLAGVLPFVPRGIKPGQVDNLKDRLWKMYERKEISFDEMNRQVMELPPDSATQAIIDAAHAPAPPKPTKPPLQLVPTIPPVAYHKTNEVFDAFDPATIGKNDYGYAGRGVYMTPAPLKGLVYGKHVLEVEHGIKNPYVRTMENWSSDPLLPYTWIPENIEKYGSREKASEAWTQMMREKGYDGFVDMAVDNGEIVSFDPSKAKIISRR